MRQFNKCTKAAELSNPKYKLKDVKLIYMSNQTQVLFLFYVSSDGKVMTVMEDNKSDICYNYYLVKETDKYENACYELLNKIFQYIKSNNELHGTSLLNKDTSEKLTLMIFDTKNWIDFSYKYDILSETFGELVKIHKKIRAQYWFTVFDFMVNKDNTIDNDKFSYYLRYGLEINKNEYAGFYDVEFNNKFYFIDDYITEFERNQTLII